MGVVPLYLNYELLLTLSVYFISRILCNKNGGMFTINSVETGRHLALSKCVTHLPVIEECA